MSIKSPYSIIQRPIVTEEAIDLQTDHNTYVFEVAKWANKIEIRQAVESLFRVPVIAVRTLRSPGKWKRVGVRAARSQGFKKAFVRVAAGKKIDFDSL